MKIEEYIKRVKLTKKEKEIVEFILKNLDEVCFMTSSNIARKLNIGDTTIIRLSKKLGFSKFSEFKKIIQDDALKNKNLKVKSDIPYERISNKKSSNENLIDLTRKNFIKKKEYDALNNSEEKYVDVLNLILNSNRKFIAGFRNSSGISNFFATLLSHILPNVQNISGNESFEDKLIDSNENDILILFSFPRYSKNALISLEIAKENNTKIIVFTDKITSTVAEGATKVILNNIDSIDFPNSLSGTMLSIEVLINLISNACKEKSKKRLKKLDKYMNKTGLY